jgi:DNA-binding transcriptional MerR regulator
MSGPNIRRLYYSAGEIAKIAAIKPHLLTGWEAQFPFLKPMVRGGRRLYTPSDLEMVFNIKRHKDEGWSNDGIREALSTRKTKESDEAELFEPSETEAPPRALDQGLAGEILRELKAILQIL